MLAAATAPVLPNTLETAPPEELLPVPEEPVESVIAATTVPLVKAEHLTRICAKPEAVTRHDPVAVADVTAEPPATGVAAMATKVPPELVVPSNWSVALKVPVSWITAAAEEGVTFTVRQAPAVVQAPESEAVRFAVAGMV